MRWKQILGVSRRLAVVLGAAVPLFLLSAGIDQCQETPPIDDDGDGYYAAPDGDDCDDGNPDVNPGAEEVCNAVDDDCNGLTDEAPDEDGDAYSVCNGDCDDQNPDVHPNAVDGCDGIDNDCDNLIDEDGDVDFDGDGFTVCDDCNDSDAFVYPGATELCDDIDNDCDGDVDEGDACSSPSYLVRFEVIVPPETPIGSTVYIVGDMPVLGGWDAAAGVPLNWEGGLMWSNTITLPSDQPFEYKYVLDASWDYVEVDVTGNDVPNRVGMAEEYLIISDRVAAWKGVPPYTGIAVDHLVINEVDYDNVGTDYDEFVEIFNPTGSDVDLSGKAIVLVNGNNSLPYRTVYLDEAGILPAGGYLVVASATVPVDPDALYVYFGLDSNAIQNGSPDAVALMDMVTGELIDALSYEGEIDSAVIVTDAGELTYNLVEDQAPVFGDSSSINGSMVRIPNGSDTDWAYLDWMFTTHPTPGFENIYQPTN